MNHFNHYKFGQFPLYILDWYWEQMIRSLDGTIIFCFMDLDRFIFFSSYIGIQLFVNKKMSEHK